MPHASCRCPPSALQAIAERLRQRPELFPQVLSTLFEIVLFEDCTNQWSLSRPMLRWVSRLALGGSRITTPRQRGLRKH